MWSPIAVVAIWLVAAPSGSLIAGSITPRGPSGKHCVVLPQRGGSPPTFCVPGSTFKISCNRCICRRSGMSAFCTKKDCVKELEGECGVGDSKVVDCNICVCSPAGKWACTNKQCRSVIQYIDCDREPTPFSVGRTESQRMCVPGTSFMKGCDRCYCANDGISAICRSLPCNGVVGTLINLQSPAPVEGYPTLPPNLPIENGTHFCFHYGGTALCANMKATRDLIAKLIVDMIGTINVDDTDVYMNETHACLGSYDTDYCTSLETILVLLAKLLSPDVPQSTNPTVPDHKNATHSCVFHELHLLCIGQDRIAALEISYIIPRPPVQIGSPSKPDSPTLPGKPDFMNETHVCFIYDVGSICVELSDYDSVNKPVLGIKEMSCTPLTTFKDDCNTCWCDETGKMAHCTLMACIKPPNNDKTISPDSVNKDGLRIKQMNCTPLTCFKDDCNTCWCDATGKMADCTSMKCVKGPTSDSVNEDRLGIKEMNCTPLTSFKDDCNMCWCDATGKMAHCTGMNCVKGPTSDSMNKGGVGKIEMNCTPRTSFMVDCNTCWCGVSGKVAQCTLMECNRRTSGFSCTPGTTYKEQCNICMCLDDGKSGTCTTMPCVPGSY